MRRLIRIAALAGAMLLAAAIPAALGDDGRVREVSIPGKAFAPGVLQILIGDTVVWRNGDATDHTVTADDDSFDSGFLSPGSTFTRVFAKVGKYTYYCSIHKFMRGTIVVVPVALQGPGEPVVSGGKVVLQGLAPSGTKRVMVEQVGKVSRVERQIVPAADGSFTVTLRARGPVAFRARVTKQLASTPVRVAVAPRVMARLRAGILSAGIRPSRAGAAAVLQRYDRERFAWQTVAKGRVDSASHVAIRLPRGGSGHFRLVVRGGRGWADGASPGVVRH